MARQRVRSRPGRSHQCLAWSLVALTAMLVPAANHVRPWIIALVGVLILWRLTHAMFGWTLPGRFARGVLTLAVLIAVFVSYQRLSGVAAGSALLVAMAGLKLIESHTRRDYFLLLVIALFIGLSNFLYAPDIGLLAYTLPALWLTVTALVIVSYGERSMPSRQAARTATGLLIPAVPIAVILFLVFPRIPGPVWSASGNGGASTGLGDSMSPGSISNLALSDRIAFRVRFDGDPPPLPYWRGPVLHHFEQGTWTRGTQQFTGGDRIQPHGPALHYTVTLEPDNRRWLYALAVPTRYPDDAMLDGDYTLYAAQPVRERRRYDMVSYPQSTHGADADRSQFARDLQLPQAGNPRARALAARWRRQAQTPQQIVRDALALFSDGDFYYTLRPPPLGRIDGIDRFLFDTREGFCGHYASAFTYLMRAAGIPARIVTGYVGGERNPLDGYWVVRDAQAHAWAEVWFARQGWVRIDPTAVLPPNRISQDVAAALGGQSRAPAGIAWLRHAGYAWDAANTFWNQWILGYGPTLQKQTFAHLGVDYSKWTSIAASMLLAFLAVFATATGWFAWRAWPRPTEPAVRLYGRFCRKLESGGVYRARAEGPYDFAARAAHAQPERADVIREVTDLYVALRYERKPPADGLRRLANLVRGFRVGR